MAVFRVEKTRNYTVMSNYHLRDKSLSLKAKGLLSLMLSLPEDWDYTTKGLARICKDGVDSICATVRELEDAGYIVRQRERHADGTLGGIEYTILEQPGELEPPKRENPVQAENTGDAPKRAFPEQVKPVLGKPEQEKPAQFNIQEQSKEKQNTDVLTSFPSFWREDRSTQKDRMERRKIQRMLCNGFALSGKERKMAKTNKADMSCARVKQYTAFDVSKAERHNERKNETYENMNVITERIALNVHMKENTLSYTTRIGKTTFIVNVKQSESAKKPLNTVFQEICRHEMLGVFSADKYLNLENLQKSS